MHGLRRYVQSLLVEIGDGRLVDSRSYQRHAHPKPSRNFRTLS
jgi:hypothetical protein